ncbi:MAG: transcriptional regulator, LysR family [Paenibacillus sp.]|nr:transcriptional regulator, LysR family [Paenibacillus sp.]
MIDQIEGKWFKTFAAVYEHKSISKAAEQLGYVQSTLTTHIQLLERACGRRLFNRLPRGVEPTEAGIELSYFVNQFLELGEAMNEALQTDTEPKGVVKLQVLESFCVSYMPAVFARFFEQFPQVQLELSTGFYKDTLEALLERRIHLGIVPKDPEREDVIVGTDGERGLRARPQVDWFWQPLHLSIYCPRCINEGVGDSPIQELGICQLGNDEADGNERAWRCVGAESSG